MINNALSAFLDRIYSHDEDPENLYIRVKVGASCRKAELVQSNVPIIADSETMAQTLLGYLEGWVYEEGDKCFVELMKTRSTNPLERCAFHPSDVLDPEMEDEGEYVDESSVKTLTSALVTMALDCNQRATISQERFISSIQAQGDIFIELAHAQAALASSQGEETPAWVQALSGIAPVFGPLIGDVAKTIKAKQDEKAEEIKELEEIPEPTPDPDAPPIVASPEVPNPFDRRIG